jgi:hypothetical protein
MQEETVLQVQKLLFICYSNLKTQQTYDTVYSNYWHWYEFCHAQHEGLFDASCVICHPVDLLLWARNVCNLHLSLMSFSVKSSSMIKWLICPNFKQNCFISLWSYHFNLNSLLNPLSVFTVFCIIHSFSVYKMKLNRRLWYYQNISFLPKATELTV